MLVLFLVSLKTSPVILMEKGAELAESAGFFSTSPGQYFSSHLKNKNLSIMVLRIGDWDECFQSIGRTGFSCLCPRQGNVVLNRWRGGWQGSLGAACRQALSVLVQEQVLPGASWW